MGCVQMHREIHVKAVKARQDAVKSKFSQSASDPYITATGQISVPMVTMTGEWSKTYPVWIEEWGVSREEYSQIIATLENATKPLATSMWDAQRKALTSGSFAKKKVINLTHYELENREKMPQVIDSTLYGLNQSIFGPKGLQALCSTTGSSGIVIFKKENPSPQQQATQQQPPSYGQANEIQQPPSYGQVQQ